jgi:exodeoxyribonuclease VII small subunit
MSQKSRKYEDNYAILEKITESLNKDEVGIDDLVEKTREALDAARTCMEILNKQKGEFKKLETEFSQLLRSSAEESPEDNASVEENIGQDDPF